MAPDDNDRRDPRIRVALEIEYRSAGAFLVAYTANLGRGGLFLETSMPLPEGTRMRLRLHTPAGNLDLDGSVAWTRSGASPDDRPAGMGIEFEPPEKRYGDLIDEMVRRFAGLRVLLDTGEPTPRAILYRYLRSIVACEIVELDQTQDLDAIPANLDLAVVDLDSCGTRGEHLLRRLNSDARIKCPTIALAQAEQDRARALELGADEVVTNPPAFTVIQGAVIRGLARPSAIR